MKAAMRELIGVAIGVGLVLLLLIALAIGTWLEQSGYMPHRPLGRRRRRMYL
jgi:hypothetical protein